MSLSIGYEKGAKLLIDSGRPSYPKTRFNAIKQQLHCNLDIENSVERLWNSRGLLVIKILAIKYTWKEK